MKTSIGFKNGGAGRMSALVLCAAMILGLATFAISTGTASAAHNGSSIVAQAGGTGGTGGTGTGTGGTGTGGTGTTGTGSGGTGTTGTGSGTGTTGGASNGASGTGSGDNSGLTWLILAIVVLAILGIAAYAMRNRNQGQSTNINR